MISDENWAKLKEHTGRYMQECRELKAACKDNPTLNFEKRFLEIRTQYSEEHSRMVDEFWEQT